ncbi:MAG: hypothetical protein HYX39_10845 [Bacteroidetes bacterium]|nr:hypothetical protein [Bacteroidota bacterium]
MPFKDVIKQHFSEQNHNKFNKLMADMEALLQHHLHTLSEEENQQYGKINEQNKLFVNKVRDYHNSQPALSSPDVDWKEFDKDAEDRLFLETSAMRLEALAKSMMETKRLHDYDNYNNARIDYKYTKYKAETDETLAFKSKAEDLKQFFPGTGSGKSDS